MASGFSGRGHPGRRWTGRLRWIAPLVALAAALSASCAKTRECTTLGCDNGMTIAMDFDAPPASDALRVKICLNGTCNASVPSDASDPYRTCVLSGQLGNVICYFVPQQNGRLQLNLRVITEYSPDHAILHDGDALEVHVTDASGAAIADLAQPITYEHLQPNGAECDGDFYCQTATIRKSF